jgi:2-polyprenyl-3-methyl-5-hydroxy-6-metoxy-1,4-benzoquinol methylase
VRAKLTTCPACRSLCTEPKSWAASGFDAVVGRKTYHQPDFEIVECNTCHLLFREPTLSAQEFADYYREVDFKNWEQTGLAGEIYFPIDKIVMTQLKELKNGARILDYGCSTGRLLAPIAKRFSCYGFEINPTAAQMAADKGIRIVSLEDIQSKSLKLDCVVLVDVFEHLLDPIETLKQLAALLNLGGKLLVATGNSDTTICRLDPSQFWYFRIIEHVCMLNRKHAEFLGSALNMTLVGWFECSHYETSLAARASQRLRHFAYWRYVKSSSVAKKLIEFLPVLGRIRHWHNAPAVTYQNDHVVVVLEKRHDASG